MNKNILIQVNKLLKKDGLQDTFLDEIKLFKTTTYEQRTPLVYDFCLIIVLQGKKIGHLAENTLVYDSKNYLVVPTTLPLECETYASEKEPFICMIISIDKKVMNEIIDLISTKEPVISNKKSLGIFSDKVTSDIEELCLKLLKTLESQEESKILGSSILKELFYRIGCKPTKGFFFLSVLKSA